MFGPATLRQGDCGIGVEDVTAVELGRERFAKVDTVELPVCFRPGIGQSTVQAVRMDLIVEFGTIGCTVSYPDIAVPARGGQREHGHGIDIVNQVLHLLVIGTQCQGAVGERRKEAGIILP